MKIIPKFQAGGFSLGQYLPNQSAQQVASAATQKAAEGNLTQKDLLGLVKEMKGLPSDTNKIIKSLEDIYKDANLYTNGQLNSSSLVTTYLSALLKLKIAEYNETQFKNALTEVTKNGGLHEYAIDEYGKLYCAKADGSGYKKLSIQEFYNQKNKDNPYIPLTNSNLLRLRAEDPNMSFDNRVLTVVSNGIGEEKVTGMIQKALSKIGTSEFSKEGYTARLQEQITKGLNLLADLSEQQGLSKEELFSNNGLLSIDGLYKSGLVTKDLKNQIAAALAYLWKAMPENARTWLAIKSGNTEDPNKGAKDMLSHLMFASQSVTSNFDLDYQKDLDIKGNKISSKSESDKFKEYAPEMWLTGKGEKQTFFIQNGTSDGLKVLATSLPLTKDKKPMGQVTLDKIGESDFAGILDTDLVSFGDEIINFTALNNVVANTNNLYSMDLPIDALAARQGIIKPDLNFLKNVEKADEYIRNNNIQSPEEINKVYNDFNLPVKFIENNGLYSLNIQDWHRFGVMNAYALQSAFTEDPTFADYITEVEDDKELDSVFKLFNSGKSKEDRISFDKLSGWDKTMPFFNGHDAVYKSTIYIPVKSNYFNALAGSGNYPTVPQAEDVIEPRIQAQARDTSARARFNPQGSFD